MLRNVVQRRIIDTSELALTVSFVGPERIDDMRLDLWSSLLEDDECRIHDDPVGSEIADPITSFMIPSGIVPFFGVNWYDVKDRDDVVSTGLAGSLERDRE